MSELAEAPLAARAIRAFEETFGRPPTRLVRAPGRVNLIGEHTDYNHGFVLPMAIDRFTWIAFEPWPEDRPEDRVTLRSLDRSETRAFSLQHLGSATRERAGMEGDAWIEYARGVAWVMLRQGASVRGFRGVVASDVPMGAGLSSSAALELAVARALASDGVAWDPRQMALLAQRAEREWVGVQCGIMDQLVCAMGQRGSALLIDCRSLETTPVPVPDRAAVVILDTGTRRGLVDSAYGDRRARCERAATTLGLEALRDIRPDALQARAAELDPVSHRRARHVVGENQRTVDAARALERGDLPAFGALMDHSHASLGADFEVTSPALDTMVECARRQPGCLGARLTGAGFAGCAVALVESEHAAAFSERVLVDYRDAMSRASSVLVAPPRAYVCRPADGARLVSYDADADTDATQGSEP